MPEPAPETMELHLAEAGRELRPAVEAAQYAQVVSPEGVHGRAEQVVVARFVQAFGACVEAWPGQSAARRRQALAGLDGHLEALERHGLFVHSGVARRTLRTEQGPIAMPLAILTIGRRAPPTRALVLPHELRVDPEPSGPRH